MSLSLTKNHLVGALHIERLVQGGYGMARLDGEVILIPFTAPGDLVIPAGASRRRGVLFAEVGEVVEPSPLRGVPACPQYGTCGGCQLMHINYGDQVRLKAGAALETVRRVGRIEFKAEFSLTHSPRQWGWRHRARLHARRGRLGFFRRASHSLVDWEGCPVLAEGLNRAAGALDAGMAGATLLGPVKEVEVAQSPVDGAITLFWTLARGAAGAAGTIMETAGELLAGEGHSLAGQGFREEGRAIGGATEGVPLRAGENLLASPGTFFQVNPFVNGLLVGTVLERLRSWDARSLLDLYCGNGNFSLAAASAGLAVTGVESSTAAIADARSCAPASARFVGADVESFLRREPPFMADAVLADPPRAGLGRKAREGLERWGIPRLLYVSCDAASLARDLVRLTRSAYRLTGLGYFDMFPHAAHGEVLAVLERLAPQRERVTGRAADPRRTFSAASERYLASADHSRGPDLDLIVEVARALEPDLTLDVATGAGHALQAAAPFSVSCLGMDAALPMLRTARRHLQAGRLRGIRFVQAWAEALPLAGASADLVLCRIAAHHFASIPAFLKEVHRVLTPRGRLVLVDSVVPENKALAAFLNRVERLRDPSHGRSLAAGEFEGLMREAGLSILERRTFERTHPFREWAARAGASEETVKRIERVFLRDEDARRHFQVRTDGDGRMVSYTDEKGIFVAGKANT